MITATAPVRSGVRSAVQANWPQLVCWLAALWSAGLAVLGVCWMAGLAGYPFGPAGGCGGGVAMGVPSWASRLHRIRRAVLVLSWLNAVVFLAVVPDFTIIVVVGGLLWAATAVTYQRRSSGACVGRGAVVRAVRDHRIAWVLGWPLRITEGFHQMMADTPACSRPVPGWCCSRSAGPC